MKTSELKETLELLDRTVGHEASAAILKLIENNQSQLEQTLVTKADLHKEISGVHKEISKLKSTLFASLGVFATFITIILALFQFLGG